MKHSLELLTALVRNEPMKDPAFREIRCNEIADSIYDYHLERSKLLASLKSALRYIEVKTAYQGAMTADEVEARILENHTIAEVEIGANSCNTLARFDIHQARQLIAENQS